MGVPLAVMLGHAQLAQVHGLVVHAVQEESIEKIAPFNQRKNAWIGKFVYSRSRNHMTCGTRGICRQS